MRRCHATVSAITSGNRLLVFDHVHHEAGSQVPAGTLKPVEDPIEGAAFAETGLANLTVVRALGVAAHDNTKFSKGEIHHRTFLHLRGDEPTPETGEHWEGDPDEDPGSSSLFRHFRVSLDAVPPLIAGHDAFLPNLY